ncbi:hypothetical protein BDV39DRAFT_209903 [Aspergillus sergii]|uniref:AMP-dependent synthetase/ligase domain-containing protein n=1 Tax=Aspergillus sergii TaxID=1034303 RepID=A0A5N6WNU2_9EURO|nr:hypothetical protein BDV39DRAFT_209903 [Aspergillus sergii]
MSLGIPVEVYDTTEAGEGAKGSRLPDSMPGELVTTAAFPNIPVGLWGKDGYNRYHKAYLTHFDISINPHTGQLLVHGRSDGVLNPSGIPFGSSEIYQVIERGFSAERVILFLLMKPGHRFTKGLAKRVKTTIRKRLSAHHVPSFVFPTHEIPVDHCQRKTVELPVKQIVSGAKVKPSSTLSNPASLDYYYRLGKVEELMSRESRL